MKNRNDTLNPATLQAMARVQAAGLLRRGKVTAIDVRHDSWCPLLNNGEECQCNPDLYVNGRKVEVPTS